MRLRTFLSCAVAACAATSAGAQQKLKVYISVDLEGIAGVVSNEQTSPNGREYGWARNLMMAETNAAIAGAYEAGATEVLVNDSHGPQTNLRPDELDRRASLITGQPKPLGMAQGLDSTFDAAIYIGYHANGSVADAVHGHTFSGALKHVRINGKEVGEYGLNGTLAGWYGVPVVFVSGDRAFTEEAKAFLPGVEALAVKDGIGFYAARTMNPLDARDQIRAGVRAALAKKGARPVRTTWPATLEIEVGELPWADKIAIVPGMKRSGRVLTYVAPDGPTLYKVSRLIMYLAQG